MRLILLSFLFLFCQSVFAQAAGAIAIIGVNTTDPDQFTFVVVDDLPDGTTIFFTDRGVESNGMLRAGEGVIQYTVPSGGLSQGDVVLIGAGPTASIGNVVSVSGSMSLGTSGDQVIAFTGSTTSPTFIAALQTKGNWKSGNGSINDDTSHLPPGLANGTNAIALRNEDNWQYIGIRGPFADRTAALAALNSDLNWTGSTTTITLNTADFAQFLPVNLLAFKATAQKNNVLISFTTATEENNSHFLIQHSGDGKTFETISRVEGKGNSSQQVDYAYTDTKPLSGTSYYRLQQFDFDGANEYFGPISVRFQGEAGTAPSIWPVPAHDMLEVSLPDASSNEWLIEVYGLNGRRLLWQNLEEKTRVTSLDISSLPAGSYLFRWMNGQAYGQQRFVKQ